MSKSDWLRSSIKRIFRPKRYNLNDSFYLHLDKLFSRRFPDLPLPLRRKTELAKLFDANVVVPSLPLEENTTTFSIKTDKSESITTNKISQDIINYIISVTELSEYVLEDTTREALEAERDVLGTGKILNKVFLLFKHLKESKGIKCQAIENIIHLETPFREATLLMCMATGERGGRAGKFLVISPAKRNGEAIETLEQLNKSKSFDDLKNNMELLKAEPIHHCFLHKNDSVKCYKLALSLDSFNGAVIGSSSLKLPFKINNQTTDKLQKFFDVIKLMFATKQYDSKSVFFTQKELLVKHKNVRARKIITDYCSDLRKTTSLKKSNKIDGVLEWESIGYDEKRNSKFEYHLFTYKKHFLVISPDDSIWQLIKR